MGIYVRGKRGFTPGDKGENFGSSGDRERRGASGSSRAVSRAVDAAESMKRNLFVASAGGFKIRRRRRDASAATAAVVAASAAIAAVAVASSPE